MAYKIWLVVYKNGAMRIGVRALGRNWQNDQDIADVDYVFGTQIGHRCSAKTPGGWKIMTPTEAKKKGYRYRTFPGKIT